MAPGCFMKPLGTDILPEKFENVVQNKLIKDVVPYFRLAQAEGKVDDFYAKVYNVWFQRWPIVGEWYSDQAHKDWAVERHKNQIQKNITWALLTNTHDPDLGLTWEQGLELVVRCMVDGTRPKPRPLKRRAIDDADGAAARLTDPSIRTVPVGLNTELRPLKRQGVDVDGVASKTTSENPVALWWKSYATDIVPGPDTSTNPSSEDAVASSVKKSIHIEKEIFHTAHLIHMDGNFHLKRAK